MRSIPGNNTRDKALANKMSCANLASNDFHRRGEMQLKLVHSKMANSEPAASRRQPLAAQARLTESKGLANS